MHPAPTHPPKSPTPKHAQSMMDAVPQWLLLAGRTLQTRASWHNSVRAARTPQQLSALLRQLVSALDTHPHPHTHTCTHPHTSTPTLSHLRPQTRAVHDGCCAAVAPSRRADSPGPRVLAQLCPDRTHSPTTLRLMPAARVCVQKHTHTHIHIYAYTSTYIHAHSLTSPPPKHAQSMMDAVPQWLLVAGWTSQTRASWHNSVRTARTPQQLSALCRQLVSAFRNTPTHIYIFMHTHPHISTPTHSHLHPPNTRSP